MRDRTRQYLLTTEAAWAWKWQEKIPERFFADYVVAMKVWAFPPPWREKIGTSRTMLFSWLCLRAEFPW